MVCLYCCYFVITCCWCSDGSSRHLFGCCWPLFEMNFVPGCWYVMFLGCWLQLLHCSFSLHGSIINTIIELLRVETWHNSLISFLSCGALWWQICSYLDTEMLLFGKLVYGIAEWALTRHYASRIQYLLWFKLCFWLFFVPSAVFITSCYWFSTPNYDSTCNNVDFNHSFPETKHPNLCFAGSKNDLQTVW